MNGHKIIGSAKGVYELTVNNALRLYDCQGTGVIEGTGKGVAISSEGNSDLFSNFEMYGGTIRNFATGVSLPKGTFTMEGGTITDNAQGGVSARRVDMNGGEITGNGSETSDFGGVKVEARSNSDVNARFKITGGKITNNKAGGTANRIAGGVLLKGTVLFFMVGGEISGNQAIGTGVDTRAVGGVNAYDAMSMAIAREFGYRAAKSPITKRKVEKNPWVVYSPWAKAPGAVLTFMARRISITTLLIQSRRVRMRLPAIYALAVSMRNSMMLLTQRMVRRLELRLMMMKSLDGLPGSSMILCGRLSKLRGHAFPLT